MRQGMFFVVKCITLADEPHSEHIPFIFIAVWNST